MPIVKSIAKYQGERIPVEFGKWLVSAIDRTALGTKFTMQKLDDSGCKFHATLDAGCSLQPGDVITMFSMLPIEKH
jgi:hypothetical protein